MTHRIRTVLGSLGLALACLTLHSSSVFAYCDLHAGPYVQTSVTGKSFAVDVVKGDTAIQNNDGNLVVWSKSDDSVLRTYAFLGYDPAIGPGPDIYSSSSDDHTGEVNAQFYSYTMGYCWAPQTVGTYGITNPIDTGGTYSGRDVNAPATWMYNQVTVDVGNTGGTYDIVAAWGGVQSVGHNANVPQTGNGQSGSGIQESGIVSTSNAYPPNAGNLQAAMAEYAAYGVSALPTVAATWGGTFAAVAAGSYSFPMLNGTDTKFCDPASIATDDMLARAPYVFNGIYCDHLGIKTATTDPGLDTGTTNPPITMGVTTTPADRAATTSDTTVTRTTRYQGMDTATTPATQSLSNGCADITGPHEC